MRAGAAGAGAAAGGGGAASVFGFGRVWLTAALQAGDRLLTFFCRQTSASWPRMPEHFDMASLRQFARNALWTSLEICAVAAPIVMTPNAMAKPTRIIPENRINPSTCFDSFLCGDKGSQPARIVTC
ncbi:MAG TPA: hypothetical protein VHD59_08605 [Pseudolabrys sp.]|nr:hypothetical protein [Pseudolabrys sp.]